MKFVKWTIAAIVAVSSTASLASDWWFTSNTGNKPNRTLFFVDKESIRKVGNKASYWSMQYYETMTVKSRYAKIQFEFDCDERTSVMRAMLFYNDADELVSSKTFSSLEREINAIAPDTVAESHLNFVCSDSQKNAFHIGAIGEPTETGALIIRALNK